jgi:hypothetical protein
MRQEEKSYQFGFLAGLTTADRLDLLQQYPEIDKAAAIHDAEEMALKKGLLTRSYKPKVLPLKEALNQVHFSTDAFDRIA